MSTHFDKVKTKRSETKCPLCGEEIFRLVQVRSEVVEYALFLNSANQMDTDPIGPRDDGEVIHYECPICDEAVCYSFADAEKILRGEKHDNTDGVSSNERIHEVPSR